MLAIKTCSIVRTGIVITHSYDEKLNGRKLNDISEPFWNQKKKDWYVLARVENLLTGRFSSRMYPFKISDIEFDV
ncbi:hypothetical protein [Ammoniphilus sp. YIM 78166]|uniref:hypothetical protein n=1 Tax=Ammoniphilus sp. YIM 78166 TaxID=1644106 RepID=UPI00106F3B9D|nr:hypothetical protein [Ammoniphilus sp. YIM 78166]